MYSDSLQPAQAPGRSIRVAIVGSGIAGLAAARTLQGLASLSLFEAGDQFGGHARTVEMTLPGPHGTPATFEVDVGVLVFNERTSPNLLALLSALEIPVTKSEPSFSMQVMGAAPNGSTLEWSGADLSSVFAQRRNLASPRFLRMLADITRFNRLGTRLTLQSENLDEPVAPLLQPLGDFLRAHRFSDEFRDWYCLPLMGAIWNGPTDRLLALPTVAMVRFCHNHGLLQIAGRPPWCTVAGGVGRYVRKIVEPIADRRLATPVRQVLRDQEGVRIVTDGRVERFDAVIMACHSDQTLELLDSDASEDEREVLGAIRCQPHRAVLHTDASVLPANRRAWAAWNGEHAPAGAGAPPGQVCLHYLINRLQPLPVAQPVLVSLNPQREIAPGQVVGEYAFDHPLFDLAAIRAQARVSRLQGRRHTWFAGAWTGHGFHEDGLKSGLRAARAIIDAHGLAAAPSDAEARHAALPGVFG